MSRVVILGAGISGHTSAAFTRRWLGSERSVTGVSSTPDYNWIPSNIWVRVGLMKPKKVVIPLAPVHERHGIEYVHAAETERQVIQGHGQTGLGSAVQMIARRPA